MKSPDFFGYTYLVPLFFYTHFKTNWNFFSHLKFFWEFNSLIVRTIKFLEKNWNWKKFLFVESNFFFKIETSRSIHGTLQRFYFLVLLRNSKIELPLRSLKLKKLKTIFTFHIQRYNRFATSAIPLGILTEVERTTIFPCFTLNIILWCDHDQYIQGIENLLWQN